MPTRAKQDVVDVDHYILDVLDHFLHETLNAGSLGVEIH